MSIMIKWDLLLCGPAFLELAKDFDTNKKNFLAETPVKDIVRYHFLAFSDKLLEAYDKFSDHFSDEICTVETNSFICQSYIIDLYEKRDMPGYSWIDDQDIKEDSDIDNLLTKLYNVLSIENRKPLFISDGEHEKKKYENVNDIKIVSYPGWLDRDIKNPLTRNCIGFNYHAETSDDDTPYKEWFSEVFSGEDQLFIFDSHFLKKDTIDSFLKYFAPRFQPGTRIKIYCESKDCPPKDLDLYIDRVRKSAINRKLRISIVSTTIDPEHDRFIYSKSYKLNIGVGLDFLSATKGKVRRSGDVGLIMLNQLELERITKKYSNRTIFSVGADVS